MGFAKVSNFDKVKNTQLSLFLPPSYFYFVFVYSSSARATRTVISMNIAKISNFGNVEIY
jgi:hypothetical protein